jgi:ligand-binding sensor domain-containing protein
LELFHVRLIKFNIEKQTFEIFEYHEENTDFGKANTINTILESDKGILWLGTWKKGILTFNTKTNKFCTLPIIDKSDSRLNGAVIRSLLQITTNKILAGTYENGLYLISTNDDGDHETVNYTYQI